MTLHTLIRSFVRPALTGVAVAGTAWVAALASPAPARACGGFFCSQSAPVNQAAERILFAYEGEGEVTAVIQIMYQGPAESFSWLLPISSVPEEGDIGIASDVAFQRLQSATNPQYNLTTRVEGQCKEPGGPVASGLAVPDSAGPPALPSGENGGVTVEASGVVGQFEWTVISFDESLDDPADAATEWLEANDYDVSDGAPGLIRPYLEDGLNLLALKLVKGADSGSIRPISLSYPAERPMIPIKLTAVAANDDMGVMTWVLEEARAVPKNYLSLELNEARINWFNASANYDEVVTAAADEAGGQGFVTEYADQADTLAKVVWTRDDDSTWESFDARTYASFRELFDNAFAFYGGFDGFWDAVRTTVTLPDEIPFADFRSCPNCYGDQVTFSPTELKAALKREVVDPLRDVQRLIDRHAYVTRLYTTMSANEMTVDPLFTFNPDLDDVSNIHSAERVILCNPGVEQWEAPWRIDLPQGGAVFGTADQLGTWPAEVDAQPANFRVKRLSESGQGRIVEDHGEAISGMLADYNASLDIPEARGGGCSAVAAPGRIAGNMLPWAGALVMLLTWRRRRAADRPQA